MQLTPHRILQQYIPAKKLKWFTQEELKQLQYGAIKIDTVFIMLKSIITIVYLKHSINGYTASQRSAKKEPIQKTMF